MEKVFQLHSTPPAKFGFEKVRKRKKGRPERQGQMNLFSARGGQVLHLPTNLSVFEEALLLDERDDPRAEAQYRKAIEEGDSAPDAYCNLGIIQSRTGETAKAFDC